MVTLLIKKAIDIALFIGFLAVTTSLVGVGSKIFNLDMPTVPAFNFQVEAGGEYSAGNGEIGGSFAFDFGGTQTASTTNKAALNSIITSKGGKVNLSTNTTASKLGADISAPGRDYKQKGNQLPRQ